MTPLERLNQIEELTLKRLKLQKQLRELRTALYNTTSERERLCENSK